MLTDIADSALKVNGNQSINGVLTFTQIPLLSNGNHFATKENVLSEILLDIFSGVLATGGAQEVVLEERRCYIDYVEVCSARENNTGGVVEDLVEIHILDTKGEPVLVQSGGCLTVKTASETGTNTIEVYDSLGLENYKKIIVDGQLASGYEVKLVKDVSNGTLTLVSALKYTYTQDSNVRGIQIMAAKTIMDGFAVKIINRSNDNCAYLVRIKLNYI